MVSSLMRILAVASLVALTACGEQTLQVNVQLLTRACPGPGGETANSLDSVSDLEFVVTGDGIDAPLVSFAPVGDGRASIPEIPLGAPGQLVRRLIEVRGHFNGPAGVVTARGGAMVQMSTDTRGPITVPIFMRPVQTFLYTSDAAATETCTTMNRSRAGHSATLLNDGRVLLVGGAEYDTVGGRVVHDSAELYDPDTGTFSLLTRGQGGPTLPRAFHTASLLQDGRVLLAGGEYDGDSRRDVLRPTEIFDPASDQFSPGPLLNTGRARHVAASMKGSVVVVAGGYAGFPADGSAPMPIKTTESWDATAGESSFSPGPELPEARAEGCASVLGGELMGIAGGITSTAQGLAVSDNIHLLRYGSGILRLVTEGTGTTPVTFRMPAARYGLACGTVTTVKNDKPAEVMVAAGGYTTLGDYGQNSAYPGVDVLDTSSGISSAGSLLGGARGRLCAVQVDSGSMVFVGGYNSDDSDASSAAERLAARDGTAAVEKTAGHLIDPRMFHACTRLADGSILVTGGRTDVMGDMRSIKTAELYTPVGTP